MDLFLFSSSCRHHHCPYILHRFETSAGKVHYVTINSDDGNSIPYYYYFFIFVIFHLNLCMYYVGEREKNMRHSNQKNEGKEIKNREK